jgi:hypothetical protein
MAQFNYTEWRRLKDFHLEIGLLGLGFTVLVTILAFVLYRLGSQIPVDKISNNPYIRFVYACMIKPHDKRVDGGQQGALESFYAAQVGQDSSTIFSLTHSGSGQCI